MSLADRRLPRAAPPPSRGVHHLALNTDDMKATIDFYARVLGMPLVHALRVPTGVGVGPGNRGNPPFEILRHYFFDAGVEFLGPIDVGAGTQSIYFHDPNGIRLEYSCQRGDGDDVRVLERWTQTRDEALDELRSLSDDAQWLDAVTRHLPASR